MSIESVVKEAIEWGKALAPPFMELLGALSESKDDEARQLEAIIEFQRKATDEVMRRRLALSQSEVP